MIPINIIAVDFDGTLCENKWPEIGEANEELFLYLKKQRASGAKIILWTCRNSELLEHAVTWCKERGLDFDAVNQNCKEVIEEYGEDSRKITATEYIDDKMCTRFKLPFVSQQKGITDIDLDKLPHIFGFDLFDWQKAYLKGDDSAFPRSGRMNGKTFAYCIRLLLGDRETFNLFDNAQLDRLVDEDHGSHYKGWFRNYIRDLNKQLLEAGFSTNSKPNGVLRRSGRYPWGSTFGDAEIAIIEAFIGRDGPIREFKEIQALAAMQFEIYKQMMQPTYMITTNYCDVSITKRKE